MTRDTGVRERIARYAALLAEGRTQAEIAALDGISGAAVSKFIRRYFELVPRRGAGLKGSKT